MAKSRNVTWLALAAAIALGAASPTAQAGRCERVRVVVIGAPSESWRTARDELVAATSEEGHLWSCAAGELVIDLTSAPGATLRRRDAHGRTAERRVADPGDLVPAAEALLALPAPPVVVAQEAVAAPGANRESAPPVVPATSAPHEPRLVVEASVGARYGGSLRTVWGAGTLALAVPIEAWSVGAWVRYALPYVLDATPEDFSMSDAGFGLSVGRRLVRAGAVELHATFNPSIGFVTMEGGTVNIAQGAKVAARLGLGLRAVFPWTRMWRGVATLDGEVSPAEAAHAARIDPALPPLPAWSVGASFGVGAAFL